MQLKAIEKKFRGIGFSNSVNLFGLESKDLMVAPLQIIASLVIIVGLFSLMFEIQYFTEFSLDIYFGRVIATAIGFIVLVLTYFEIGKKYPIFLVLLCRLLESLGKCKPLHFLYFCKTQLLGPFVRLALKISDQIATCILRDVFT